MNTLKVDFLSYIESIKLLSERLDECNSIVVANLIGPGGSEITTQINSFVAQFSNVCSRINSYIQTLNQIEKKYENSDVDFATQLIRDIEKLDL